jgi:hypothetical protein
MKGAVARWTQRHPVGCVEPKFRMCGVRQNVMGVHLPLLAQAAVSARKIISSFDGSRPRALVAHIISSFQRRAALPVVVIGPTKGRLGLASLWSDGTLNPFRRLNYALANLRQHGACLWRELSPPSGFGIAALCFLGMLVMSSEDAEMLTANVPPLWIGIAGNVCHAAATALAIHSTNFTPDPEFCSVSQRQ